LGKAAGKTFGQARRAATGMAFSFATTYALGQVAKRYYAGGRVMSTAMLRETFQNLLGPAKQLQTQYLPQIQQKAATLDAGQVMAMAQAIALPQGGVESVIATNRVIRNTYLLLSLTLAFSALAAGVSVALKLPHPGIILTLVGFFGLLFAVHKLKDSGWGILAVFAMTGFMGYTLGPVITRYLGLPNGGEIVMQAMGATAAIFIGLSAYAVTTKKDFSFMGGFLMVGILLAFLASLAAIFFEIPALSLTVSAAFVLLMSGLILYETSNIIHGGETNYVLATVTLFVSIFNLFTSLLQLLGFMNSSD
jgi:modulator of FtsH protease